MSHLNVFIRQPFTESEGPQQEIIQSVMQEIRNYEEEFNLNFLVDLEAHNASSFKEHFSQKYRKEFTPQNFRSHRLSLLDKADAFINIRTGLSESSAFEIAYNIFQGRNAPMFFAVYDDAKIKTTLIRELEDLNDVTYVSFNSPNELKDSLREFFEKVSAKNHEKPAPTYTKITADEDIDAAVVMSDGTCFFGKGVGKKGKAIGEICFNTSMTGYQEILTDPSYAEQIITFTFPHIGNVGCNTEDNESDKAYCKGLVVRDPITQDSNFRSDVELTEWLKKKNLVAISEVDTRALTRDIRENGARVAAIQHVDVGEEIDIAALVEEIAPLPTLNGMELAANVTTKEPYSWNEKTFTLGQTEYAKSNNARHHVVVVDYGVKTNILRCLCDAGMDVTVVPAMSSYEEIAAYNPDGVFLSNGPGDPFATAQYAVPVIKQLLDANMPLFGICLGNQLLSIASGLSTVKMSQGHRGGNHPVSNTFNKKVEITSQNHGFCVSKENVPSEVEITHLSLFDNTIEGIRHTQKPAFSVQHHPESSPGPHDSKYIFEEFAKMIELSKVKAA